MTLAHDPARPAEPDRRVSRRAAWLQAVALLVLMVVVTVVRVRAALDDPQFDARSPVGLLKSDPGLLYHLTDRIVAARGAIPADFAADRTIEYPDEIDVAQRFPLGHLRLIAWVQLALGGSTPLHVTSLWVSASAMAFALLGVWLLALELTRRPWLAFLAALLAAATPAFHRTIGFVLVDEDFSWPLLVLHLALVARAARVRTPASVAIAVAALAGALSTWHAAGFFASLEAAVALALLARDGRSPLALRGGWLAPAILAATTLAVPFLRHAGAVFSFPVAVAAGLWLAARTTTARGARIVAFGATAAVLGLGAWIVRVDVAGAYGHVFALLAAKIRHMGLRPSESAGLGADVRILWQGPFETPDLAHAVQALSLAGILAIASAVWALRARDGRIGATVALFALSLGAAWLAERALVLPALIAPALVAWAAARLARGTTFLAAATAAQALLCTLWLASYRNPWYHAPEQRQAEIRWMVQAVERHVPPGEAVAADFMTSTAILAHTGRPIVFSPKWEAREPRRRATDLVDSFHHASPAEFRRLIVDRYRARWLVVDRFTLGYLARWSAGLPSGSFDALPGTAAAALLSQDEAVLDSIPGYELIARSPASILQSNGRPTDFYRLYRLGERP